MVMPPMSSLYLLRKTIYSCALDGSNNITGELPPPSDAHLHTIYFFCKSVVHFVLFVQFLVSQNVCERELFELSTAKSLCSLESSIKSTRVWKEQLLKRNTLFQFLTTLIYNATVAQRHVVQMHIWNLSVCVNLHRHQSQLRSAHVFTWMQQWITINCFAECI